MQRETYQIELGDVSVSLESDGTHVFDDEGAVDLHVTPLGNAQFAVLFQGRSTVVTIEDKTDAGVTLRTPTGRHDLRWKDRRALLLDAMGFSSKKDLGNNEVRAPMPGLVLKVLVEVGQEVAMGDGLVVLEAMKMENELRAAGSGTVKQVQVAPGDAVGKNDLLIELVV